MGGLAEAIRNGTTNSDEIADLVMQVLADHLPGHTAKREVMPNKSGAIAPCPWCGSKEAFHIIEKHFDSRFCHGPTDIWQVQCTGEAGLCICDARGPVRESKEEAIAAWNASPRETRKTTLGDEK